MSSLQIGLQIILLRMLQHVFLFLSWWLRPPVEQADLKNQI